MSKNVSLNIRVDESTRLEAERIFDQLGLTMSGAINMFLKQVVRERAVPLSMELDPMFTPRSIKEDMEEARKMRAEGISGIDADDLAAQMDAIIARAEARL